ncbi:MAG: hypothetical protein IKT38_03350 [Clostridia bacterium]|nr:hypothetical protein [Clostridia bacterium]
MKKILALVLALFLLIACCGCKDNNKTVSKKPTKNETTQTDDSNDAASDEYCLAVVDTTYPYNEWMEEEEESTEEDGYVIEKVVQTLDTKWYGANTAVKSSRSDAKATELRNKILNSANTDVSKIKGTIYYVSPKGNNKNDGKSPATAVRDVNADIFRMGDIISGDAVLFERGGLWRLTSTFKCEEGVTYGSYGTGNKPSFYASAQNYADSSLWIPSNLKNVWKLTVADTDIGLIAFNYGELVGVKKFNGIVSLEKNGDFYYNKAQDTLYVYCNKGNPGKVYENIEVALRFPIITAGYPGIVIDNLCLKYTGTFGIYMYNGSNTVISNCEIGFIGGAIQSGNLRYGNGIQSWNGAENQVVKNNWIYQVYDAGVTWQGDYSYLPEYGDVYKNITYERNLIEYCTYSFEWWHANNGATYDSPATVENFKCINNICRFAGYGFGAQRPDVGGSHIKGFQHQFPNAKGNVISGNIFDLSLDAMVDWRIQGAKYNGEWDVKDNEWYKAPTKLSTIFIYDGSWLSGTSQSALENAVSKFDKKPAKVEWIS